MGMSSAVQRPSVPSARGGEQASGREPYDLVVPGPVGRVIGEELPEGVALAVSAARGPPSRHQATLTRPAISGRQVLLFHASARDELTPPLHRAPPGQQAGSPLAESTPSGRAFVPGVLRSPGFDAIVPPIDASAVVHSRSSSRRTPDPLSAGLSPRRSPPRLLTGAARGGLGSPPARRTQRAYLHHWHSTVRAGDLLHRLHSPFRTHRRSADQARSSWLQAGTGCDSHGSRSQE